MPDDQPDRRPNVVIVITDDQGYGEVGAHGNDIISTPNLDEMYGESARFTDFHVGPTCAPTRAGLMTGRYCNCTGVWHTIAGWSLLRRDEITLGDMFRNGGYETGMFGKWHLGDNYPFHPENRGFGTAIYHGGGGVGQTPDYWGNDYFDDTYFDRGEPVSFDGYCTDIWFDLAMNFIEENRDRPFFCYLSTNAPHGPYRVDDSYSDPYTDDVPQQQANFYGMITNIDDNMARLRAKLRELDIERDTILIFMTDNGSAAGCSLDGDGFVTDGYNAGMRGKKGWPYEGGHRVVFYMRWPGGGLTEGRDVGRLTANIDVMPTLADLCDIEMPAPERVHGTSFAPLLFGDDDNWPDRVVVTDSQRVENPIKWRQSSTMTERWRLINGEELYDIEADPGQRNDVADEHPDIVERLREEYEQWWEIVSKRFDEPPAITIGSEHEETARITCHDWHNEDADSAWNQGMIRKAKRCNGHWAIDVAMGGKYELELRRWPKEEDRAIVEGIPGEISGWWHGGREIPVAEARVRIAGQEQSQSVSADEKGATFTLDLPAGRTELQTWFVDEDGEALGAYFVYATWLAD